MKKLFFGMLLMSFFIACNSNNTTPTTKTSPDSTGGGTNMPAVDNVNGNVPDSTIKLNQPLPKDSSKIKDSVHH